jgi:hypothetical protein
MSYNIYLYHPDVKSKAASVEDLDEIDFPTIPDDTRQRFVQRLLKYNYELETDNPNGKEFIHKNRKWSIQVVVFRTEIAFSVPYWDDAENAVFEALQTAHELADGGDLVVYDPQTEEWSEA